MRQKCEDRSVSDWLTASGLTPILVTHDLNIQNYLIHLKLKEKLLIL